MNGDGDKIKRFKSESIFFYFGPKNGASEINQQK